MGGRGVELPADGVVRIVGPKTSGTGFVVSAGGLVVTCAHVVSGCVVGGGLRIAAQVRHESLPANVELVRDPPDVALLRVGVPLPPEVAVLPLGRSPTEPQGGLRTFGYPQLRAEAGLPGELAVTGLTRDQGFRQLALRSDEATVGFSGAPIWDPRLHAVVGMVKSIALQDPGERLRTTAIGVPVEVLRQVCPQLRLQEGCPYRGLEPFTEDDIDYYVGRDHAVERLLAHLAAHDVVPVVAVSGSGKSSLLRAGLAKGLRDRPVIGLAQRTRCYLQAGAQPGAELLHSLAKQGITPAPAGSGRSGVPPGAAAAAIRAALPPQGLIIVVDQFERLYTDCEAAVREEFIGLLLDLAGDAVKVVIGLRPTSSTWRSPTSGSGLPSGRSRWPR